MDQIDFEYRVSYDKMWKKVRKLRITVNAFLRKAQLSEQDKYLLKLGEMMTVEGELRVSTFLKTPISELRDIYQKFKAPWDCPDPKSWAEFQIWVKKTTRNKK